MYFQYRCRTVLPIVFVSVILGCAPEIASPVPPRLVPPPTLGGIVSYDNGVPAAGALIAITNITTGGQVGVAAADPAGRFQLVLPSADYALAVTDQRGFAWVEKQAAPDTSLHVTLSRSCTVLSGHASSHGPSTHVNAARRSNSKGDRFVSPLRSDGSFAMCLPDAYYNVFLTGETMSLPIDLALPSNDNVEIKGFSSQTIHEGPRIATRISANLNTLIADITSNNPTMIGLGEATHGTAEFVSARGELTLALVQHADVRLLLFEVDAVNGIALDDYVNGVDVDIAKAVAALGFWVTDTYEFLRFLESVRNYNATTSNRVHIWGVDLQDTVPPVNVITSLADALSIGNEERATLKIAAVDRGRGIAKLPDGQRVGLASLLSRLGAYQVTSRQDLLIAVAARSLALQLNYWDGDARGQYRRRRDSGMATLASFIAAQVGAARSCIWAHDGHITKEVHLNMLGRNLASDPLVRYYGIGFYLYQGTTRAWDPAAKIGVISHSIPPAPSYTLEGAIMSTTGMPDIAWLPLRGVPAALRVWLDTPRLMREVGAVYHDADDTLTLRHIRDAFDALVVLRTGHDSSPTPTGVRKVMHE